MTANQTASAKTETAGRAGTGAGLKNRAPKKVSGGLKLLGRVLTYAAPYKLILLLGTVLILADVTFNVGIVVMIQHIIDVMRLMDLRKLYTLLAACVAGSFVLMLLMYIGRYYRTYVQSLIVRDMSSKVLEHISKLPYSYMQKKHSGDLVQRVTADASQAADLVGGSMFNLVTNLLICVIAFAYLSNIDFKLALLAAATGPVTFAAGRFFDSKIRKLSKDAGDRGGELRGVLQEFLQLMHVVRAYSMQDAFRDKFIKQREEQIGVIKKRTIFSSMMWRAAAITNGGVMFALTYIICVSAVNGKLSIGSVVAFVFLMGRVQWPFINMSATWGIIQQGFGAADRIFDILDTDTESEGNADTDMQTSAEVQPDSSVQREQGCYALEFENIWFDFGSEDNESNKEDGKNAGAGKGCLYAGTSFSINEGEIVALVGPSGSGKTTIARLCCGLLTPDKGEVRVYGMPLSRRLLAARQMISYVPQYPYLFSGTVRENISYGKANASGQEIEEATKAANAHEFILELEKGYDTLIGEHGSKLSGGQRQRIAIARAFLRKAPLIILDEATSSLDNESEHAVQQSMERLLEGRTALVIAHRLSTVRNADRILVLDKGTIVEEGTHNELMDKGGLYANLYNIQFAEA